MKNRLWNIDRELSIEITKHREFSLKFSINKRRQYSRSVEDVEQLPSGPLVTIKRIGDVLYVMNNPRKRRIRTPSPGELS